MPLLLGLLSHRDHHFWVDDLSWSESAVVHGDQVLAHGQITDAYLLALAVHHQGLLVTLDSRISTRAVQGGEQALQLIQTSI